MNTRIRQTAVALLVWGLSLVALAEPYTAGTHYEVLATPVRTADPARIEVNEVFWYGCSHCFAFEPALEPWIAKLPADVNMQRTPAIWQDVMETHAKIYYTAQKLGVLDKLHSAVFTAINKEKKNLDDAEEIAELFAEYGVDKSKFIQMFNSFSVASLVKQAQARAAAYRVQSTPEIVINGKYRVSGRMAGSQEGMLKIAEFLIEKERSAKAAVPGSSGTP